MDYCIFCTVGNFCPVFFLYYRVPAYFVARMFNKANAVPVPIKPTNATRYRPGKAPAWYEDTAEVSTESTTTSISNRKIHTATVIDVKNPDFLVSGISHHLKSESGNGRVELGDNEKILNHDSMILKNGNYDSNKRNQVNRDSLVIQPMKIDVDSLTVPVPLVVSEEENEADARRKRIREKIKERDQIQSENEIDILKNQDSLNNKNEQFVNHFEYENEDENEEENEEIAADYAPRVLFKPMFVSRYLISKLLSQI